MRRINYLADEDNDGGYEVEDPPPPIPDGFESYTWNDEHALDRFLLWSKLDSSVATWHSGVVTRALQQPRADGFTHDAKFGNARYARGTTLTAADNAEGVLVLIRPKTPNDAQARAPAPTTTAGARARETAPAPATAEETAPATVGRRVRARR